MNTPSSDEAVQSIGRVAGDDFVLLAPPSESHFDPFSAVVAFAALLATSYLRGFIGHFEKSAESLGEQAGQRISRGLGRIFRGEADTGDSADQLDGLLVRAAQATVQDRERATQAADAARMRLVDALVENGLPASRALRLASAVQQEMLPTVLSHNLHNGQVGPSA